MTCLRRELALNYELTLVVCEQGRHHGMFWVEMSVPVFATAVPEIDANPVTFRVAGSHLGWGSGLDALLVVVNCTGSPVVKKVYSLTLHECNLTSTTATFILCIEIPQRHTENTR